MIPIISEIPLHAYQVPAGTIVAYAGEITDDYNLSSPPGEIPFPRENTSPPSMHIEATGWMRCDGRELKTYEFPELFYAIGYLYGGSDDTFNIPNLYGAFLRGGWDNGTSGNEDLDNGATEDRVAAENGQANGVGSVQKDAVQKHEHVYNETPQATVPSEGGPTGPGPNPPQPALTGKGPTSDAMNPPGEVKVSQYESRPHNVFINYIIKYVTIF